MAWTLLPLANLSFAAGELDQAKALYERSLHIMGEIGDLHGLGAVLLGLGMLAQLRGDTDQSQLLLAEAQTKMREGSGGQGLSWPISNVLVPQETGVFSGSCMASLKGFSNSMDPTDK